MKKLFAVLVLLVLAAAVFPVVGCGDDTVSEGDAGTRPRVTMTSDKTMAAADGHDMITLKLVAKDGTAFAADGSEINLESDLIGSVFKGGTDSITVVVAGGKGEATASLSSTTPGTANVKATYKDSASAKLVVTFGRAEPDAQTPCSIFLGTKNSVAAQIEADGQSQLDLEATVTGPNGSVVADGTEVTFTTTDGSFERAQTDPMKLLAYTVRGKAVATLTAGENINPNVVVGASFLCGAAGDAGLSQLVESNVVNVVFTKPTPRPRLTLSADSTFVIANGIDKATITAVLQTSDPQNNKVPDGTSVAFSTSIGTFDNQQRTVTKTTAAEKATADLSPGYDTGTVTITATAVVESKNVTDTITLKSIESGSITCYSITKTTVGLKGSGQVDNTTIVFQVEDNNKNPISKLPIDFTMSNAPGGVYITPTQTRTDNNGLAQTVLYAGTVPTTVTVTAKSKVGDAACAPIVITTGVPNWRHLNFSCEAKMINVAGFSLDLIEQPCTVSLGDRFSNKIPFATKVFFRSEAGAITPAAETSEDPKDIGTATVTLRTQDPRPLDVEPFQDEPRVGTGPLYNNPRDGLVTIIVATTGEEEFSDDNGNGICDPDPDPANMTDYNAGKPYICTEPFVDLGEPFVDMNDNNTWDSGEPFIDVNGNGQWDGPNGKYDAHTVIWKPTWVMWTGDVVKQPNPLIGDCAANFGAEAYSMICPPSFDIANGASNDFFFTVKDFNLNPINTSGRITVKVDGPAKIVGNTDFQILPMLGTGIKEVRTPDQTNSKITHVSYAFGNYTSGYSNSFVVSDDNSTTNQPTPAYVSAEVTYGYDPSATGDQIKTTLYASGLMDSTKTTGSCGVDLTPNPTLPVPADGVASVTITAKPRDFNGQPMADGTKVTFMTPAGQFVATGTSFQVSTVNTTVATATLVDVEGGGTVTVRASFTCGNGRTYTETVDIVFMPIQIAIEPASGKMSMLADGADFVTLTASVTDASRHAVTAGTLVRFTTTLGKFHNVGGVCVNTTIDSPVCDVATNSGQAIVDIIGGYITGDAKVTASILGSNPVNSTDLTLKIISLGKVDYVNVSRQPIGVKNSGYQENAEVTFRVLDNNSMPLVGQRIDFSWDGAQSGMSAPSVAPLFVTTGADGLAKTTLSSGTLAGQVRVFARGVMGPIIINASSDPLSIVGAKVNRGGMFFTCEPANLGGFADDRIDNGCNVQAFDRYNNKVQVAQPVMFMIEAGTILPVVNLDPGSGTAAGGFRTSHTKMPVDVAPLAGEPSYTAGGVTYNPRDGLVTVVAAVRGEEEFDDMNGNGVWDAGEPYVDQGEPFVDANDNDICDPVNPADPDYLAGRAYACAEQYLDMNGNGKYDPPNGQWDADAWIWRSTRVLWTGALAKGGDCSGPGPNLSIICPPSFSLADGGSQHLTYEVKDARLNPPNQSTRLQISAPNSVTLIGDTNIQVKDTLGMTFKVGRQCNPQNRCVDKTTISGFQGGYVGSFDLADETLGDSGQVANINVVVDINYANNPQMSPDQHDNLISQGAINDPNAVGPCAFKIEANPPTAVANGRDTVQLNVTGVRDQSGGIVASGTAITLTTDKGKFSNGNTTIMVLTDANGDAQTGLLVGNEPGVATIQASFNCNGKFPERTVQVVLLDPGQVGKASISLVASASKVLADNVSTATINAFAFQSDGAPAPINTPIKFTTTLSTFVRSGTQADTALTDATGTATVQLKGGTQAGLARVSATYDPDGVPASGDEVTGSVEISIITLGSIRFTGVNPDVLGVKHSGYNETGAIGFQLLDNNGQPFPEKQQVSFTLSDAPGGVSLISYSALTDANGNVSTVIISGTVATTVTVTASADLLSTHVTGVTSVIPIIGAKPSAKYIQIGLPKSADGSKVMEAANFDEQDLAQEYQITAYLGDRYSNNIERSINVHFRTEGGTITPQVPSSDSKADALLRKILPFPADVDPVAGEPSYVVGGHTYNPRDGLVTIIAVTTGEEEFQDNDGDGDFTQSDYYSDDNTSGTLDIGDRVCKRANIDPVTGNCSAWVAYNGSNFSKSEPFVDLPEPFVDGNDNGICDPGEPFFDTNHDGYCGDITGNTGNDEWDSNTNIWAEGFQTWTGSYNNLEWAKQGTCGGAPSVPGAGASNIVCPNAAFALPNAGSLKFTGVLCDQNLNSLFSEREGGILGLWSTSPGIYIVGPNGVQLQPITSVSEADPFPLDPKRAAIVKWVKQAPVDKVIAISGHSGWYKINRVIKLVKSVQAPGGCKVSASSLDDVDPTTTLVPPAPTYIRLGIVDKDGNSLEEVATINGTCQ